MGILSKLRHYLNNKTLLDLYYALIYRFFSYCIIAWGNTHKSTLQPLFVIQKRAIRRESFITFSGFLEYSSLRFKKLTVIKLLDGCSYFSQYNLVLSTGLIMWIGHRKEIRKLRFRALALRRSESQCCFHAQISKSSFYKFWVFFTSIKDTHNYSKGLF